LTKPPSRVYGSKLRNFFKRSSNLLISTLRVKLLRLESKLIIKQRKIVFC